MKRMNSVIGIGLLLTMSLSTASGNETSAFREALRGICPVCTEVVDDHDRITGTVMSVAEVQEFLNSDQMKFRAAFSQICPDCYKAVVKYEELSAGRLLSLAEVSQFIQTETFDAYLQSVRQ